MSRPPAEDILCPGHPPKALYAHTLILDMLMCKKMVTAVLEITLALGAESELHVRSILFGTSANRTFMSGNDPGGT